MISKENDYIPGSEKEASGLRLLSGLNGVQKVGSSNLPAPTIASTHQVIFEDEAMFKKLEISVAGY